MIRRLLTVRTFGVICSLVFVLAATQEDVRADDVFIAGFTNGCFGAACAPGASATMSGLTYSNSTFAGTTAGGFRGLGGNANPGSNFNNLGSFSLSTAPNTFNSSFTLLVTFTGPQGIVGSNNAVFVAGLSGTVVSDDQGGIFIDFDNTPLHFTFNDLNCEANPTGEVPGQTTTCGNGSFVFSVNDLAIDPGQTDSLTGQIMSAQQSLQTVPEPVSMILMGTGLIGVAGAAKKRLRRKKLEE